MAEKEEKEKFDFEHEYNALKSEYSLPDFDKLSEDFDVEKSVEKESNYLLREVRRVVNDKLSGYIHLLENLINPSNPPMFILSAIRNLDSDDKDLIKKIYKKLSKLQIEVLRLDTVYIEKDEAKYIIEAYSIWQDAKKDLIKIIDKFGETVEKDDPKKERGYFG